MRIILRYARERLHPSRLAPAVALVAGAAPIAGGWHGGTSAVIDIAVAAALISAFRIWDDLADREPDRLAHPHRVSADAGSARALIAACLVLSAASVALVAWRHGAAAVIVVAATAALLGLWYVTRGPRSVVGDHLRLVKYPAFTAAIAGPWSAASIHGALSIATVYLAACVYEWSHDPRCPVRARTRVIEATLLAGAASALVLSLERVQ